MRELENKKILFLITKSNFGGAQRYVYDLTSFLVDKGVDLKVAFGGQGKLYGKLKERSVPTISIPDLGRDVSLLKDIKVLFSIIGLFKKEKPEIVHLNSSKAAAMGSVAAKICNIQLFLGRLFLRKTPRNKIKVVFTVHGWAFNEQRNIFSKIVLILIYWLIILCSDVVICVSSEAKRQVSGFPFVKNKLKVMRNAIAPRELKDKDSARSELAKKDADLKKVWQENKEGLWVGTISELHPIKGLPVAVDAISSLVEQYPDLVYIIIGEEGPERQKIEQKIEQNGLENNIFVLGFVEGAPSYLRAFDIFTLSSYSEGLAYVVLEAGYAGLPVVATEVGGIPEVITNDINGKLVTPGDYEDLKDRLRELIDAPEKRGELGRNLKSRVERYFNLNKLAERVIAVYSGLVKK